MFWIYHSLARSKLIFIWVPAMTFSDDIISTTWSSDPSLLGYFSIMVGAPMPPLTPPYLPARCWPLTTVVVSITGFTGGDDGLFPNRKSSGRKRPFNASLRDRDIWYFSFCCYFKNKINKKMKIYQIFVTYKIRFFSNMVCYVPESWEADTSNICGYPGREFILSSYYKSFSSRILLTIFISYFFFV